MTIYFYYSIEHHDSMKAYLQVVILLQIVFTRFEHDDYYYYMIIASAAAPTARANGRRAPPPRLAAGEARCMVNLEHAVVAQRDSDALSQPPCVPAASRHRSRRVLQALHAVRRRAARRALRQHAPRQPRVGAVVELLRRRQHRPPRPRPVRGGGGERRHGAVGQVEERRVQVVAERQDVAVEEPPVERALAGRGRVGVGVGEVAPAEPRAGAAGVRAAAFGDVDDGGSEAVAALRRRGVAEAGAASERAVVVVAARRPSAGAGLHGGETRRRGLVGEAGEQREEVGAERGAVAASGRRHRCRGAVDLREVAGRVELSTAGYNGARAADDDEEELGDEEEGGKLSERHERWMARHQKVCSMAMGGSKESRRREQTTAVFSSAQSLKFG
ncbi:hypothetical protein DAI22_01g344900 [Oryza sativa Japonica Group]|nr:hypothetical protein DAI22_01g344900 [Oryza sativa Japonica Group]